MASVLLSTQHSALSTVLEFRDPVSTWTHLLWMILSVPATWLLWSRCRGDRPKQISVLIFGMSLMYCFLGSTLFHAVRVPEPQLEVFATLDYIGIYVLIAGTCTPILFTMLTGWWRLSTLLTIWSLALVGIVIRAAQLDLPPWLSTALYLGMGWSMISCFPELVRVVPHRPLTLVPLGGGLYSVGAALYLAGWPTLWPGVIGSHELMHFFVMAGSATHFWFMLKYVAPFERVEARPEPLALGAFLATEESGS